MMERDQSFAKEIIKVLDKAMKDLSDAKNALVKGDFNRCSLNLEHAGEEIQVASLAIDNGELPDPD